MIVFGVYYDPRYPPPPLLPVIVGVAFFAYPHLMWLRGKGQEVSDGQVWASLLVGGAFVAWGTALWLNR